jgi:valyl-tRNA synthetase
VFDANPKIEEALKERGRLWHRAPFSHQYPHCWRCHTPVIFLATAQWFISLDGVRLPPPRAERATASLAGAFGEGGKADTTEAGVTPDPGGVRLQPDQGKTLRQTALGRSTAT